MKYFVTLVVLLCFHNTIVNAQNPQWYTPQNSGLIITSVPEYTRFDDIYFVNKDTGFLASGNGRIYKTYDGAKHWSAKLTVDSLVYFRSVEFSADGQYGIAGSLYGAVLRSADRGETWQDITFNLSDTGIYSRLICGLGHWGNSFYGVGWWGASAARFYKSPDAGLTWQTVHVDTALASGLVDVVCLSIDTIFVTGYHALADGTEQSVVLKSTDTGNTWQTVFSDSVIGGRIWKIQFLNNQVGVGSIEPIFHDTVAMIKTIDGGNTWNIIPIGHKTSYSWGTQGIGFATPLKGWIGGYYSGLFRTTDGGQSWDSVSIGQNFDRFCWVDSNTMYASGSTVYKYADSSVAESISAPAGSSTPFRHKLYPISPNPSTGMVTIEFDLGTNTNTLLQVVSVDARRIFTVAKDILKPGHYSYTWNGSNMPAGNYLVWLGTNEIPVVEKFVITR